MKPLRLQLQGFTAFHNRVTVEFEGRKLFAITGPTGAGKSSLLDAMVWALFGKVPRVGNQVGSLISHGANLARVQLEFEARGQHYVVARARPVKGTTTARLERVHPGGDHEPLADSVNEVNAHVEQLLGINYDTFVKTIILPQGEFSAFLSGDPKEKKDVLSRLLGLDMYRLMMQASNNRASGARSAADLLQQQHDQIEYQSPEALATLETQLRTSLERQEQLATRQAALKRLETVAAEHATREREARAATVAADEAARRAREAARGTEEAQRALAAAGAAHETLTAELAALDYDPDLHELARTRLAAASRLDAARSQLAASERAVAAATAAQARAHSEVDQHRDAVVTAQAALEQAGTALVAVAQPAAVSAAGLEHEARAAEGARSESERKSYEFELRARQLQHLAGGAIALRRELEVADSALQRAVAAAATAEATRIQCEAAEARAADALQTAQQHLEAARLKDTAAAILSTLEVGDPCPVCGDPITELKPHAAPDLDAAERALDAARAAHAKAAAAHQRAGIEAAAAHALADAARGSAATVEARQAALDQELAAASVTGANVDRAAKRASTAAAAEHDRAVAAQRRADASTQAAQCLRVLLVRVAPELTPRLKPPRGKAVNPPPIEDIEPLAATLGSAIEQYATASGCADAAATSLAHMEAGAAIAAAEVKTTVALHDQQAGAVDAAMHALVATGAPADASFAALQADIEARDALAARASEVRTNLARAEQQHAAASAVVAERLAACEAGVRAHTAAANAAAEAVASSDAARRTFELEWRQQLPPQHDPDVAAVGELLEAAVRLGAELASEVGRATATLEAARADVARAEQLRNDTAGYRQHSDLAGELGLELQSNRFVAFIQREAMQALAADAGERMLQLSRERYRLEADGDEFVVVDRLNGDERRSVRTLSGGETFLASLALALALSERLPELSGRGGALSLESLFLDEGFGSLDAESLDVAIQGLELLASGSRMIGVISHVAEVAERLTDRIEVVKTGGTSTIRDGR